MEKHLKFLIAAAVSVPVFVELRTLVVFVDENVSFDRPMSL